jgi:hypothetical protein
MTVVTISRELGSDGTQIAEAVAAQLGADCIDKEVMAEMARKAGVSIEVITHAEEQLLARPVAVSDEMRALMSARRGATLTEAHFVQLLRDAIQLLAGRGKRPGDPQRPPRSAPCASIRPSSCASGAYSKTTQHASHRSRSARCPEG